MSRDDLGRRELLDAVLLATRKLTGQGIVFSQAVADRLGLAATDAEALQQLAALGRATAGQIAELTGLTTGAATRMIDRLEQSGFVRRAADPADRRRVIVEPVLERVRDVEVQYAALRTATLAAIERYSDRDLGLIRDYLERTLDAGREQTVRLTAPPTGPGGDASSVAPLGGTTSGRLVFVSGAPYVTLRGEPSMDVLYRARFKGAIPKVRVRDGAVTVRYGRLSWFEWRAQIAGQLLEASAHWRDDQADITLSARVPWSIELRGGVSRLTGDLVELQLASLDAAGGISKVDLDLPLPRSIVPIRISGGANDVTLHRPAGAGLRLRIRGGANRVVVDGRPIRGRGEVAFDDTTDAPRPGEVTFETPGFGSLTERYEVELTGGANRLTLDIR